MWHRTRPRIVKGAVNFVFDVLCTRNSQSSAAGLSRSPDRRQARVSVDTVSVCYFGSGGVH